MNSDEQRRRDMKWAMQTQERLVVPILRETYHAEVVSKDLTDREWDSQGIDKIIKQGKNSFFLSVRSRTHGGYPQRKSPLNVTIRSERPIGTAEIHHLNARYSFYGVTNAQNNSVPATSFFWWVIYRLHSLRGALDDGRLKLGGELWKKYPDISSWQPGIKEEYNEDGTKWLQIPLSLLENEKWLVARYTKKGGLEQIDKNAELYNARIKLKLEDFFR